MCAPEGVSLFSQHVGGDYIHSNWSDQLGDPKIALRDRSNRWQRWEFFRIEEGERQWTWEEQVAIAWIIEDSLPGGSAQWEGYFYRENPDYYLDIKLYFEYFTQDAGLVMSPFTRKLPLAVHRQNLKNPY